VIIGAERVSLSVVLTLMHARTRVLNLVTDLPRHQLYLPVFLPAKILYADILARAPILTNKRVTNILGRQRVKGIEITDIHSGKVEIIECDTVVFTGDWVPENELARSGTVETGHPSLGPQVDDRFRTSRAGIFAAGNVLRGVETADWAALEGRSAARSIAGFLQNAEWPANRVAVRVESPLAWIYPNIITSESGNEHFYFRSNEFREHTHLQVKQAGHVLYQRRINHLKANTSLNLSSNWVEKVDFVGESVRLVMQP
jgi:hypothetical protein